MNIVRTNRSQIEWELMGEGEIVKVIQGEITVAVCVRELESVGEPVC